MVIVHFPRFDVYIFILNQDLNFNFIYVVNACVTVSWTVIFAAHSDRTQVS